MVVMPSPLLYYFVCTSFLQTNNSHIKGFEIYCRPMFNPETTRVYSLQTFNCHFQFSDTNAKHLREKKLICSEQTGRDISQ